MLPDFDLLWDYDDPAGSETRFRALLTQAKQSGDSSYYWQLLTQLARTLGLQGRFAEAHEWLDQVEAADPRPDTLVRVRYLLERGRALNSSGESKQAKPFFAEAWTLAVPAGLDFYAVDAAHMLAIVAPTQEQIRWNKQAMGLAEQSNDPRARSWLAALYNNLGWTYHDLGDYPTALDLLEKALAFRQEQGKPGPIKIARWSVARCLRSLGRVAEALAIQESLLSIDNTGYSHEEMGECLLALHRPEQANPYFAQAYNLLSQDSWFVANEPERLARLKQLAQI